MHNVTGTQPFGHDVKRLKTENVNDKQLATEGVKEKNVPFGQQVSAAAHEKNEAKKTGLSIESVKQEFKQSILKASLEVSVSAGNEPMALLIKAAIDGINDVLKAEFGDNAIQNAYDSGLDVSPQATADRIVSMSTAFFSTYREQNLDMSDEEAARSFVEIIGGGINTGFAEARDILSGLKVLEGDIASNIDTTYDLVQDGLQAFVDSYTKAEEVKPDEELN